MSISTKGNLLGTHRGSNRPVPRFHTKTREESTKERPSQDQATHRLAFRCSRVPEIALQLAEAAAEKRQSNQGFLSESLSDPYPRTVFVRNDRASILFLGAPGYVANCFARPGDKGGSAPEESDDEVGILTGSSRWRAGTQALVEPSYGKKPALQTGEVRRRSRRSRVQTTTVALSAARFCGAATEPAGLNAAVSRHHDSSAAPAAALV